MPRRSPASGSNIARGAAGCCAPAGPPRNCSPRSRRSSARWDPIPGTGGIFDIRLDGETIWFRADHGHPDLAELKRPVRDRIVPGRSLGHSDKRGRED
ncbi:hypothetical protein L083_6511 [Actinoplanes sp. N902-109]|nr:hypothetical protein L083_6511 [Actinoplanes sp. N902-109]